MKKTAALMLMMILCLGAVCARAITMTGLETETVSRDWGGHQFFTGMEELTGVSVEARGVDSKVYSEILSAMERGEIGADVLFKANLTRAQEIALADGGVIIDLAPMIDMHMPNLSALLAEHPEWKEIIMLEDGRIVSLPLINPRERQVMMWLNTAWLEKLGVDMPKTMDELTLALEAIKNGDPNGNYKADEVAADLTGVFEMRWLLPYFGIVADDYNLARDAEGKIVFAPEMPEYRAFIECLADWTKRGILTKAAFTAMHGSARLEEEDEDAPLVSGLFLAMAPYTSISAEAVDQYVPLLLAGPDGSVRWRDFLGSVWTGCFAVTSACEDPASALRWADALYAQDGALLAYAGVKDKDYTITDEGYWSLNVSAWRDMNSFRSEVLMYTGAATPGLYPTEFIESVDSELDRYVFEANARVHAISERVTQPYCLGVKDEERATHLAATIGALVDRGIARFATGKVELSEETYAAWLEELRAAGSEELTALFADAK